MCSGFHLYLVPFTDCPIKIPLWLVVLVVVSGIVVIGLIALGIWKVVTNIHDRREFAKFEKEKQQARWESVS